MDKLCVALCEDKDEDQEKLTALIQASGFPVQLSSYLSGDSFLKEYKAEMFDLILMDIYMEGISGVEAVEQIRKTEKDVPVAFITTSKDFALEGYRLDVAKYMEKPVSLSDIENILKLAAAKKEQQPGITVLSCGKPVLVPVRRLLYAEQNGHYLIFHLLRDKTLRVKGKLDDLTPQLSDFPFYRCHKSYLVNLSFVIGIDRELMVFHMREGNDVYIRRENLKKSKDAWENWLFTAARKEQ